MKNPGWTTIVLIGLGLRLHVARAQVTPAELEAADASELKIVSPPALPKFGTFYSWQHWWHPPLPFLPIPDATVYDLGGGRLLYDDRWVEYAMASAKSGEGGEALNGSSASRHGVANGMSAAAYGCALWLNIEPSTNN